MRLLNWNKKYIDGGSIVFEIKVQPIYYEKIKNREKIYEGRLWDEKRRLFKVGDKLKIYKEPDLKEFVILTITDLERFSSFREMATKLPLKDIGFEGCSVGEVVSLYGKFYSKEDEKKYGVVAIKLI